MSYKENLVKHTHTHKVGCYLTGLSLTQNCFHQSNVFPVCVHGDVWKFSFMAKVHAAVECVSAGEISDFWYVKEYVYFSEPCCDQPSGQTIKWTIYTTSFR